MATLTRLSALWARLPSITAAVSCMATVLSAPNSATKGGMAPAAAIMA